jgi:predicted ATPase
MFWIRLKLENLTYALRFESVHGESWLDGQIVTGSTFAGGGWQCGGMPDTALRDLLPAAVIADLEVLKQLVSPHHFHDTSDTSRIRRACPIDDNRQLRGDGSNLAAYLYWMKNSAPTHYRAVVQSVRQIAPWFQDFILTPRRNDPSEIKLEWRHRASENYFDGFSLSDGSLRYICLTALLLQPEPPPLIVLDEPEIGLHPAALALVAEMLHIVDSQVILATQSPALVDYFEPEDIVVAEYQGGSAVLNRLDPGQLGTWLEDYSLGTIWEKNLLGGRP